MLMGQRGRWALANLGSTFSAPFSLLYTFSSFLRQGFLLPRLLSAQYVAKDDLSVFILLFLPVPR